MVRSIQRGKTARERERQTQTDKTQRQRQTDSDIRTETDRNIETERGQNSYRKSERTPGHARSSKEGR